MGKLFKKVPFGSNILLVFFLSSTVTVTKQFNSNRRRKRTQSCSFAHGPQCFKSKRVSCGHRRRLLLLRWWRCGSGRLWAGLLIPRVWGGQPLGNRLAPAMVGAAGPLFAFMFFGHPDPRKYVFLCIWLYIHILPSPTPKATST